LRALSIAIEPGNDQILFAGTIDQEVLKSTDGGATWTQESPTAVYDFVADTVSGAYYAAIAGTGLVRVSANLQTLTQVGPRGPISNLSALAVVNGQLYARESRLSGCVTKLDPSGNILYSTYLGGSGNDQVLAMTVDAAGNVFVTGTTSSADFPVSPGAYAFSGGVFLSRLNPDGSLGFSTYFSGTLPVAVATDGSGSAWLLGNSSGGLPATPGAFATTFCCVGLGGGIGIGPPIIRQEATLTRFCTLRLGPHFLDICPGFRYLVWTRSPQPVRRSRSGSGWLGLCGRVRRVLSYRFDRIETAFVDDQRAGEPAGDRIGSGWHPVRRGYAGESSSQPRRVPDHDSIDSESAVASACRLRDGHIRRSNWQTPHPDREPGWACRWGLIDLVKLFLDRGADPVELDAEPWATPRAWAGKRNHSAVLALLASKR
jgi:hypothetical protein